MRYAILLLLLAASPAAAQSSQDWNNWVYRGNSLLRAIASGQKSDVDIMCRNIYSETAGKGFPKWATQLTTVCEALKEGTANGTTRKFCGTARLAGAQLRAAAPVAGEPRAYPIAIQLADAMDGLHQGLCK